MRARKLHTPPSHAAKRSGGRIKKPDTTEVVVWVSQNRGILTSIADRANVTPQMVHMVLRGLRKSEGGKIERMLKEAGAPGAK